MGHGKTRKDEKIFNRLEHSDLQFAAAGTRTGKREKESSASAPAANPGGGEEGGEGFSNG